MSTTFSECFQCSSLNKLDSNKALEKKPVCGKCGSELNLKGLVSEVSTNGFRKILNNHSGLIVVDFWASWCGPCQSYAPEYEKASLKNRNAIFLKINTETEQQLAGELGIRGIPCTIFFKNQKETKRQSGAMSADQLAQLVESNL